MIIPHYTPSTLRNVKKDIINAGTSNDNIKLIPLKKNYPNPKFYPRKFERDPDTFEVSIENNFLKIRRSDVLVGGWGLPLLIDVEFDSIEVKNGYRQQKIPRVIYQTFEEYEIPNGMFEAIQSWKDLNPEYEHYYYSEKDRLEFIEKFFDKKVLDAYLSIIPGAF